MIAALLLFAQVAAAPHAQATRATAAPALDGRLEDAAWATAVPQDAFTQKFPDEKAAPVEQTTFRVLYDDGSIYVGVDCVQESVPVVARLTRRDRFVEADRVSVGFDTRGDGRSAYEFTVNAAGVLSDSIRFDDTDIDPDWDESWEARVALTPRGWSAEIRIPLRSLRFSNASTQSWGLQVRRYVSARQETDEWAFIPRAGAGEVSRYGRLDGLGALRGGGEIELRPFVLGRINRRDAGTGALRTGLLFGGSVGLDAKWHAKRDLTLDLALNPDFAQVEADQLILNLSNEEVKLPEKRPFFLEGRDVFAMPLSLLYTRRIGRIAPSEPALRSGEALVDPTSPAALLGATKLTGRLNPGLGVGALAALTGRNDVTLEGPGGSRFDRPVEPRTLFQALRLKQEVGGNAHVGLFASSVVRGEDTHLLPRADGVVLCPSGTLVAPGARCTHDAYVGAIDGRWRSANGDWAAAAQLAASALRGGPARAQRDGTVLGSGDAGYGAIAKIAKQGGLPWGFDVSYEGASRRLDFNDIGYMTRQNVHSFATDLEYRTLAPWFATLETYSRIDVSARTNLEGLVLAHSYQLSETWRLSNFWQIYAEVHLDGRHFDDREVGDGTALERRERVGFVTVTRTDPRRAVYVELNAEANRVAGGAVAEGRGTVTFRVLPQLDVAVGPGFVHASGEPRFATRQMDALVFGKLEATELSSTLRATYTFTPRLSLQTYAQIFLAAGHYSDFGAFSAAAAGRGTIVHIRSLVPVAPPRSNPDFTDAAVNANVVLRWEYALGSTIFVVYTRVQSPHIDLLPGQRGLIDGTGLGRAPATDTLLVKLTHFFG